MGMSRVFRQIGNATGWSLVVWMTVALAAVLVAKIRPPQCQVVLIQTDRSSWTNCRNVNFDSANI